MSHTKNNDDDDTTTTAIRTQTHIYETTTLIFFYTNFISFKMQLSWQLIQFKYVIYPCISHYLCMCAKIFSFFGINGFLSYSHIIPVFYNIGDTLGLTPKCHVIIKFNELLYFIILLLLTKDKFTSFLLETTQFCSSSSW